MKQIILLLVTMISIQLSGHDGLPSFVEISEEISPAVVFIKVEKKRNSQSRYYFNDPFLDEFFFGEPQQKRRSPRVSGQGSGFFISSDGYILTNHHVVSGADKIKVRLNNNKELVAKLIGTDPQSDVALLKVNGRNYSSIKIGNSEELNVGQWVLAIGNPFGLSNSITAGIVSAKGRNQIGITDYENFIQTDAAINPGNSGGPLVNMKGEVVGINTAIFSQSGGSMGVGFAIPINMANQIKNQLINNGKVIRGYLGVVIQNLTPELAESFDLKTMNGVLISRVQVNSAADRSGLQQGDIILELNGNRVINVASFRNTIALSAPNSKQDLTILRNGRKKTMTAIIGQLDKPIAKQQNNQATSRGLGLVVKNITEKEKNQLDLDTSEGVIIKNIKPGSIAQLAGLPVDGVITEINQKQIRNTADFQKIMKKKYRQYLLLVTYRNVPRYYALQLR